MAKATVTVCVAGADRQTKNLKTVVPLVPSKAVVSSIVNTRAAVVGVGVTVRVEVAVGE